MSEYDDRLPRAGRAGDNQVPEPQDPYMESGCGSVYPAPDYYGDLEREGSGGWTTRGHVAPRYNGLGIAGLLLSFVGLALLPVPVASLCAALPSLFLSAVGIGRRPRRYAVAGVVLSVLCLALVFGGVCGGLPW